jgi:hypothetical protein
MNPGSAPHGGGNNLRPAYVYHRLSPSRCLAGEASAARPTEVVFMRMCARSGPDMPNLGVRLAGTMLHFFIMVLAMWCGCSVALWPCCYSAEVGRHCCSVWPIEVWWLEGDEWRGCHHVVVASSRPTLGRGRRLTTCRAGWRGVVILGGMRL